jgi:hypothetical protein
LAGLELKLTGADGGGEGGVPEIDCWQIFHCAPKARCLSGAGQGVMSSRAGDAVKRGAGLVRVAGDAAECGASLAGVAGCHWHASRMVIIGPAGKV